jgi:hypothetical protein
MVTNIGASIGSFVIEVQATSGEVSSFVRQDVPPNQSAPWAVLFAGTVAGRILRVTTYHPPPPA